MSCLALALAGCQGGGANPPSPTTGVAPPPSVTASGAVTPAGGSVSTTLGTETVVITVPPGAISGSGTLSVTVFSNNAAPKALQSSGRKVQKVGADAVLITEFTVTLTGATLVKPLQASLTTGAAASGSVYRLAGLGSSFDDVDTVTFAAGKATTDQNVTFSRMSLANGTYYAFYVEPSAEAGAAAAPVVTVTNPSGNPVGMLGTAQFAATETEPNGFPYLDTNFTFTLDNPSLGSITSAGAFSAGPVDGAGNVTATDNTAARSNPNGKGQVTVSSQRPTNVGDSFTFTGKLTTTTQLVNSNPTLPQTDTATIALATTTSPSAPPTVMSTPVPVIQTTVRTLETDTYPLQTVSTNTITQYGYVTGTGPGLPSNVVPGSFLQISNQATDSNGVVYVTQYDPSGPSGNGILDVLPEKAGAFGPNNAVLQYDETDQAKFSRHRVVGATGSYVETGKDAFNDVQTITVNSDLSASYDARQYSGFRFTMTAPTGSPAKITFRVFNSAGTNIQSFSLTPWFPAGTTQPSTETDVDNGPTTYPATCNVPAKYGTSGNQIVQTITRVDPALGNSELMTTTTYVAPRVGPVCIQLADTVKTFYDYTLQNGFLVLVGSGTTNIQTTTLNETLTLQSASVEGGTTTSSSGRSASGTRTASSASAINFAPVAFARARFEHAVREKTNFMRRETFNHNFLSQGVKTL
jgi:hypothetical protein